MTLPARSILTLNSGSSSLKFTLYRVVGESLQEELNGAAERIGESAGRLWIEHTGQRVRDLLQSFAAAKEALQAILAAVAELDLPHPDAVGHRIVSGGPQHQEHCRIDEQVLQDLRQALPFAPLHLPAEIAGIEAVEALWPGLPQVACFDTAFHRSLPELAARFPLPQEFWQEGIRKYGFHGLSYEYIVSTLPDRGQAPTIIAHLGNGASMAAVCDGGCVDTTMGLTPTGGLVMGTRCGDLDPGVLLFLLTEKGYSASQLEELLNHHAGLLGVSGCSSDMAELLRARERNPQAQEAIALFAYSARKHIGSLLAVLGGLHRLVFTGGIGEHASAVRWAICRPLEGLGICLDANANAQTGSTARCISTADSQVEVLVIPTDEDRSIAQHTQRLLLETGQ